jgi:hypothetical protein
VKKLPFLIGNNHLYGVGSRSEILMRQKGPDPTRSGSLTLATGMHHDASSEHITVTLLASTGILSFFTN